VDEAMAGWLREIGLAPATGFDWDKLGNVLFSIFEAMIANDFSPGHSSHRRHFFYRQDQLQLLRFSWR
jgi:hypothetical protein